MKLTLQKIQGQVRDRERAIQQFNEWLDSEKDGCLQWEGKRARKPKSQEQLGAIFGLAIAMIIAEFNDLGMDTSYLLKTDKPTGIGVTADLLKEYFYAVCPIFDDDGKRVTLSKMSTKQAAEFFDAIRNYASSQWGIVIPDPDRNWDRK